MLCYVMLCYVKVVQLCLTWDFPGQNTGVGSWSLLHGIFPTLGLHTAGLCTAETITPRTLALQVDSLPAEPPEKPSDADGPLIYFEENCII